jgi:hypothetical protein
MDIVDDDFLLGDGMDGGHLQQYSSASSPATANAKSSSTRTQVLRPRWIGDAVRLGTPVTLVSDSFYLFVYLFIFFKCQPFPTFAFIFLDYSIIDRFRLDWRWLSF